MACASACRRASSEVGGDGDNRSFLAGEVGFGVFGPAVIHARTMPMLSARSVLCRACVCGSVVAGANLLLSGSAWYWGQCM